MTPCETFYEGRSLEEEAFQDWKKCQLTERDMFSVVIDTPLGELYGELQTYWPTRGEGILRIPVRGDQQSKHNAGVIGYDGEMQPAFRSVGLNFNEHYPNGFSTSSSAGGRKMGGIYVELTISRVFLPKERQPWRNSYEGVNPTINAAGFAESFNAAFANIGINLKPNTPISEE